MVRYDRETASLELIKAIRNKDVNGVKKACEDGALLHQYQHEGKLYDPLKEAVKSMDYNIFACLMEYGASVEDRLWEDNQSLLYFAITYSEEMNAHIIASILANGGYKDIHYSPKEHLPTPMEYAKLNNHYGLEAMFKQALRKMQGNPNISNKR